MTVKNKIGDLRDHLFEMLENIKDPEASIDLDRYRLGIQVANSLIASAKVEVDYVKATGASGGSGYIPDTAPALPSPRRKPITHDG